MSDQPSSSEPTDPDTVPPTWRGVGGQPVTVVPMGGTTPHARVLTILFDDLGASLQRGGPLTAVRCTAVAAMANVEAPAMRVLITHHLRGQVDKDADARILVMADLGGAPQTLEFPYGREAREPIDRSFENTVELWPGQRYLMTFAISMERRGADAAALLVLDSIDLEIAPIDAPPEPAETVA